MPSNPHFICASFRHCIGFGGQYRQPARPRLGRKNPLILPIRRCTPDTEGLPSLYIQVNRNNHTISAWRHYEFQRSNINLPFEVCDLQRACIQKRILVVLFIHHADVLGSERRWQYDGKRRLAGIIDFAGIHDPTYSCRKQAITRCRKKRLVATAGFHRGWNAPINFLVCIKGRRGRQ